MFLIALIFISLFSPSPTSIRSSVWGGTLNMKLCCIIEVFLIQCVVVLLLLKCHCGEQGWRIGERTRLPPMWPGSPSIWEVSPLPSPPLNSQHFQIPIRPEMVKEEPLCGCATSKSLFILFFLTGTYFTVYPDNTQPWPFIYRLDVNMTNTFYCKERALYVGYI